MNKEMTFEDIQRSIEESKTMINVLNKKMPANTTETHWGEIYDETSESVYFDTIEEKWLHVKNETEEEMKLKQKELRGVMNSIDLLESQKSKLFKFKVDKILGYNQVNKLWYEKVNGRTVPKMEQTELGAKYQYQIACEVERNNLKSYLKPKPTVYKVRVQAFVDYAQKDVDGLKVFVDCLVRALGNGDRKTFDDSQFWDVEIYKTKASHLEFKKKEFFLVEFIEVDETIMNEKNMYSRYIKQELNRLRDK